MLDPDLSRNKPADWMHLALQKAQKALYLSDPNPRVGCVLVNAGNHCIGSGYTQKVGALHAEVMALHDAQSKGLSTQGATAYVTLEPCSHFGRTPPCAKALIEAGIKRIVIAALDPNPLVSGKGIAMLKSAGVEVEHGLLAKESEELNIGFFSRMQRQLPWVRLKMATSLDGKTALCNGQSQWITNEQARADGHIWRARASSVLTGIGTILADDPRLNVRTLKVNRQPWHVIVDTHLRTPATAAIFKNDAPVLIYTASTDAAQQQALQSAGATIYPASLDSHNRIDLQYVLQDLACAHECNELHVEAGSTLSSALLKAQWVDELLVYMAPRLIGEGKDFIEGITLTSLSQTLDFQLHQLEQLGTDLRILLRKACA